jgi:replication-associated recombination protein RarA
MDVSKIDRAILSRGQVYKFKPLSASEIGQSLLNILSAIDPEEKIPISPSVLVTISQNSWGSIRQAQQYLQACIDRKLYTDGDIEQELGFFSDEKGYEIFSKLLNKDSSIYSHLQNVRREDFYIYAWSVLSSVEKSIKTLDQEDFKYKSSIAIKNNENYSSLCDMFISLTQTMNGYFKDYIFDFYLGQYLQNVVPIVRRVREKK